MSRWFRFYDEALNDKKVQRLPPNLFKTWINLLCLASKGGGKVPCDDDVSFELRLSISDARQQVEDLILAGLIDIMPDGSREPHNWPERQFTSDTSVERTRKYRERLKKKVCDVTVTEGVTPPESYSESDTEPYDLRPSPTAARKRAKEDQKALNKFFGMKDDKKERLHARAEGMGLNVEEMLAICNAKNVKNRPAYFTSLCIDRLQKKLKGIDEQVIRSALWDAGTDAYVEMQKLLLEAA